MTGRGGSDTNSTGRRPTHPRAQPSTSRLLLEGLAVGAAAAGLTLRWAPLTDALLVGWTMATGVFLVRTWWSIWPQDAEASRRSAVREDPGRGLSDVVMLWMAAVSVVSVVVVMFGGQEKTLHRMLLGVLSIAGSWGVVQTIHVLRYARLYYAPPAGGLDFHSDDDPAYTDFAYLALTVGTTFQVSDTDVVDPALRPVVMRHGLLSFGYSTLVIATVINIVASLGSG